jgi:hypothetical protein
MTDYSSITPRRNASARFTTGSETEGGGRRISFPSLPVHTTSFELHAPPPASLNRTVGILTVGRFRVGRRTSEPHRKLSSLRPPNFSNAPVRAAQVSSRPERITFPFRLVRRLSGPFGALILHPVSRQAGRRGGTQWEEPRLFDS